MSCKKMEQISTVLYECLGFVFLSVFGGNLQLLIFKKDFFQCTIFLDAFTVNCSHSIMFCEKFSDK